MSPALDVLYEDEHCLALVKPAGQFTQGSWAPPDEQTLEQAVRDYLAPADPGSAYVGIVHRLDRAVSGVLLWAKNSRSARRLSRQFERRSVRKEYWGIVEPTNAAALRGHRRGACFRSREPGGTDLDRLVNLTRKRRRGERRQGR